MDTKILLILGLIAIVSSMPEPAKKKDSLTHPGMSGISDFKVKTQIQVYIRNNFSYIIKYISTGQLQLRNLNFF